MGRELDNAAPTIFETQQTDRGDLGLWSPEYEASAIEKEEQEGGQPIDAAEIFGECQLEAHGPYGNAMAAMASTCYGVPCSLLGGFGHALVLLLFWPPPCQQQH